MFRGFPCKGFLGAIMLLLATVSFAATDTKTLLDEAYQDELKAYIRYEGIIEQFGEVRPFVNLLDSERRHLDHLADLYIARGLTPVAVYEPVGVMYLSVSSACQVSLEAERENVVLLDRLMGETVEQDILATLQMIRQASAERHIPALERCSGLPG